MKRILVVDDSRSGHEVMRRAVHLALSARGEAREIALDAAPIGSRPTSADDAEPKWNLLFPVGKTKYREDFPGGSITFDRPYLSALLQNWERMGKPELPCDYFHRGFTERGDPTPNGEKVASGWMKDFRLDAHGLWALFAWTQRAREHILADELRYLSPTFWTDFQNPDTGEYQGPTLVGAGLLNDPFFKDLPRVAAAASPHPHAARAAETNMNWKNKLLAVLALATTASDTEIEVGLDALTTKVGQLEADKVALNAKVTELTGKVDLAAKGSTELSQMRAANEQLAVQLKAVNDRLTASENEKKEAAIEAYLTDRVKAGVLAPAMRDGVKAHALAMGLEAVKKVWDAAPVIIPMSEAGSSGGAPTTDAEKARVQYWAEVDKLTASEKIPTTEAMRRVQASHPQIAKLALSLSNARPSAKA